MTPEEREELRATVRSALQRDDAATILAEQLGAFGLAIPEEHGGIGCSLAETQIVCEELGRAVSPVPYLSSAILVPQALLAAGAHDRLPDLAEGSVKGALAWAEGNTWDPAAIRAEARDGKLYGTKEFVLDGAEADFFVVPALLDGSLALFEVADPSTASVEPLVPMDQTRAQARVTFDATPATLLSTDGEAVLERLLAVAAVALAGEQLGGAERCLEMTVEYAKTREQFGRVIGSFQAIKHRLADMYVLVESARSLSQDAARALAAGDPDYPERAAMAQSYCAEAFQHCAAETIQLHGGIGFTWEHAAHLYFKRAHSSAQLFGTPAWHRSRLARKVLAA